MVNTGIIFIYLLFIRHTPNSASVESVRMNAKQRDKKERAKEGEQRRERERERGKLLIFILTFLMSFFFMCIQLLVLN